MANIRERTGKNHRPNGKNIIAEVRVKGAGRKARSFYDRNDAEAWAERMECELRREALGHAASVPSHTGGQHTLAAALEIYAETAQKILADKTWRDKEAPIVRRWLAHEWASWPVAHLLKRHIKVWISQTVKEGVATQTVQGRLGTLAAAIDLGLEQWELTNANPARGHKIKHTKTKRRRPTPDEKARLYAAAQASESRYIYWLMRWAEESGMRRGEIARLRTSHFSTVDNRTTLTVPVAKIQPRTFFVWPRLASVYEQAYAACGQGSRVFPIRKEGITQAFQRVRHAAGVPDCVTFHSFRYEANSWMAENGVEKKLRMDIIGHIDDDISDHYTQYSGVAADIVEAAATNQRRSQPPAPAPKQAGMAPALLEKLLWAMPAEEVARMLGISGPALVKRCKRDGISKPPRGYWAKRRAEEGRANA